MNLPRRSQILSHSAIFLAAMLLAVAIIATAYLLALGALVYWELLPFLVLCVFGVAGQNSADSGTSTGSRRPPYAFGITSGAVNGLVLGFLIPVILASLGWRNGSMSHAFVWGGIVGSVLGASFPRIVGWIGIFPIVPPM